MGYDTVKRMTVSEFEMNWAIQQAVILAVKNTDGANQDANIRKTIALEEQGKLDQPIVLPFDPATATTAEIERWLRDQGN